MPTRASANARGKYRSISDLLTEDGEGFNDKNLHDAYQRYKERKAREKDNRR
jgi:hypothetical protein